MLDADLRVACEHPFLLERVVGGVLKQDLPEVRLRTQRAGGQAQIEQVVRAPVCVHRIVSRVAYPRETGHGDPYREGVQRNQGGVDHQAVGVDAPPLIRHAIDHGCGPAVALLGANGAFEALRGERVYVDRVVVEPAQREVPVLTPEQPWSVVTDQAAPGQQSDARAHAQRLVATEHIQSRNFQHSRGTYARRALRIVDRRCVARRKLYAAAIAKRPAWRLTQVEQYVLQRLDALWVLHRHVHLVEDPQVVQAPLRVHHSGLAQGIAWLDPEPPVQDTWTGILEAGNDETIHIDMLTLHDLVGDVHAVGLSLHRLDREIKLHVGKSAVVVKKRQHIAVVEDVDIAEGLSRHAAQHRGEPLIGKTVVTLNG